MRRSPIVGRVAELALVRDHLEVARTGRGSAVLLAGEAGIGKTTLAIAAAADARTSGMPVLWGRCREDGDAPPYRPFVQMLRSIVRTPQSTRAGADLDPILTALLEGRAGSPAAQGTAGRFLLFELMADALAGAAGSGEAVLAVIDDLHRADDGSLGFLRYLSGELAGLPVVILGAFRDTDADDRLTSTVGAMADASVLHLVTVRGLSSDETRAVVERQVGEVSDEVAEQVFARTAGNPFFAVEVAALLRCSPEDPASLVASAVPPTVREIITHRVDRLPPETRHALRVASVLGRDFGQLPLSSVIGTSDTAVAAALQPAATAGLVTAEGSSGYRFAHALVQAAIYDLLPVAERAELHSLTVEVVAALGRHDDETLGTLAFHSYNASAVGGIAGAFEHALTAGRRFRERLAFGEASRWLGCAVELAARDQRLAVDYVDLLCETAEADLNAGAQARARARYEQAAEQAAREGDHQEMARAALGVGSTVVTAGKVDWALVDLLDRVLEVAGDDATVARLHSRRAIELYWYEGGEPARAESLHALEIAERSGDADALGVALHARQFTLRSPDHLAERIAIGERLVTSDPGGRHTELTFRAMVWLAADVLRAGDLGRFRSLVESLVAGATRARQPLWGWYALVMRAQLAAVEARVEEAFELTEAAGALGHKLDVDVAAAYRLGQLCVLERERHGLEHLLSEITDVAGRLPYFVTIRAFRALALVTSGRMGEAAFELERLSGDRFAAVPRDSLWVATVALLLEAAALCGSPFVGMLVNMLAPHAGTLVVQGLPNCWGSVDRFLGKGHLALGDLDAADRSLTAARSMEGAMGTPLFSSRTALDLARLNLRRGEIGEASRAASHIAMVAERLGLGALGAEAREILTDCAPVKQDLSPREVQVLREVAAGRPNKEIASRLHISLNTVERHLANIYTKLAFRNRAEATAYAVRAGIVGGHGNGGSP